MEQLQKRCDKTRNEAKSDPKKRPEFDAMTALLAHLGEGKPVRTFPRDGAAKCKREIVEKLGGGVFAVGNGFNDIEMFDAAAMSAAVMEKEGVCAALLEHADVFVSTPEDALDLLLKPDRLRATLRT